MVFKRTLRVELRACSSSFSKRRFLISPLNSRQGKDTRAEAMKGPLNPNALKMKLDKKGPTARPKVMPIM